MTRLGHLTAKLRVFAKDVAGKSGASAIAILVEHLSTDLEGVRLAQRIVSSEWTADEAESSIARIEHRGDELRRQLVAELAQMIVTPLDREDLFRLSRSIDDVLDNIRDFVREWSLYQPLVARNLPSVLETVAEGIRELRGAIDAVIGDPDRVTEHLLAAKQTAGGVRRQFDEELSVLFTEDLSVELLKHRELLRRLDVVGLRFGEAVDVLFDALVKRGGGVAVGEGSERRVRNSNPVA